MALATEVALQALGLIRTTLLVGCLDGHLAQMHVDSEQPQVSAR